MTENELVTRCINLSAQRSELLTGLSKDPNCEEKADKLKQEINRIRMELGMEPI